MEVSPRRLVAALSLVFFLGVLFALVNGYYVESVNAQLPLIVYAVSFVSVMVGAALVIVFQWRISRAQLDRVLAVLPRDQRLVLKTLLDHHKMLEQSRLVAITGLSKVQVSRALDALAQKGVVEKRPLGQTNLVVLKL